MRDVKAAFSYWKGRIAPVFDTARQVHVVQTKSGCIVGEAREAMVPDLPMQKALRLVELGVGVLVCGAISRPLQAMITASGIHVIPFVAGELKEVIRAWLKGGLPGNDFIMPGCWRHGRVGGRNVFYKEDMSMNGRRQGGSGAGGGRGQGQDMGLGRGGQGRGRMGGPRAGGAVGSCVCPKCGQRVPHERGIPCVQRQCPQCGTALIRE